MIRSKISRLSFFTAAASVGVLADDISGALLYFIVNCGNILTDQSQTNEDATADNQQKQNYRGKTFNGTAADPTDQGLYAKHKADDQGNHTDIGHDIQGAGTEDIPVGTWSQDPRVMCHHRFARYVHRCLR